MYVSINGYPPLPICPIPAFLPTDLPLSSESLPVASQVKKPKVFTAISWLQVNVPLLVSGVNLLNPKRFCLPLHFASLPVVSG